MASPIEQNHRHVAVLEQAFATGLVQLPKRLGMVPIKPWIRSLVLVSNGARISRPRSKAAQARVDGLDTVIKADQLAATINRDLDTRNLAAIAKVVSAETVQRIGRELAALHRPMTVDWAARFGLPSVSPVPVFFYAYAYRDDPAGPGRALIVYPTLAGTSEIKLRVQDEARQASAWIRVVPLTIPAALDAIRHGRIAGLPLASDLRALAPAF